MLVRISLTAVLALALLGTLAPAAGAELPQLSLRIAGPVGDAKKTTARMALRAPRGGYRGRVGIELRGSASARSAKPSYSFETRGAKGREGRAAGLLGLPRDADWILDADLRDRSAVRNAVAYATSRRIGRWAPRTRHVEVTVNGRHQGLYLLAERPELDRARVVEPRGGGVLLEAADGSVKRDFTGRRTGQLYQHHDPKSSDLSPRRERAVERATQRAERAVYAGTDRRGRFDDAAAVDHLLLQELFKNQDALVRSSYLTVADDGLLALGPVFDFDRSMGSAALPGAAAADGWITTDRPWAAPLRRDPAFAAALARRWRALRARALVERELLARVDAVDGEVAAARQRDAQRWPLGPEDALSADVPALKRWLSARMAWMDAQIGTWGG